jgi:hypothetical protein
MSAMPQRSIVERMFGAAMLSVSTYEDVENDRGATGQAFVVVLLGAISQAIAMGVMGHGSFVGALFGGAISAVLGWLAWSSVTMFVGTRFFGGRAEWGELLRTLGFAQAPKVLLILGIIPVVGWILVPVVFLWTLVTSLVAIRQALDIDTGKAILTAIVGWVVMVLINMIFGLIFGIASFGAGMLR